MFIQLSTSPTVVSPSIDDIAVPSPLQVAVAPISILLAYGVPSVLMCLPAPATISFDAKQGWAGAQQLWPIWISLTQLVITSIVSAVNPMVNVLTEDEKKTKTLKYLRYAYGFALLMSVGGHLTAWGLSLLAYAFPVLITSKYDAMMLPQHVFVPVWPFGTLQANTVADGALWFLQWDVITGTAAVLLWAYTLRVEGEGEEVPFYKWVVGLTISLIAAVAVGPSGAATLALWARDELIFGQWAAERQRDLAKKSS